MVNLQLLEIEIVNMLGCDVVHVVLDPLRSVTMLLTQQDEPSNNMPLVTALELILTTKYDTAESLAPLISSFGEGACVRVVVRIRVNNGESADSDEDSDKPCTSRQALEREERRRLRKESEMVILRAERHFSTKIQQKSIVYTINDSAIMTLPVLSFYNRFFKTESYSEATLMCLHKACSGNWLSLINIDAGASAHKRSDGNPFEALSEAFHINPDGTSPLLGKLTKRCLEAFYHGYFMNRVILLKIFSHVRSLFEYITCHEYTVWFFIPNHNVFKRLNELTLEDLDLKEVQIYIKLNSDGENISEAAALGKLQVWNKANHTIKDILLIAFQLALAQACQQSILILRNLNSFRNYQCLKFATAAFFKKTYKDSDVDWTEHNYLQRVINVALRLKLTVIIQYPGGVPLKLSEVNLIRCEFMTNEGCWSILECNDGDFPQNFNDKDAFADFLEKELN